MKAKVFLAFGVLLGLTVFLGRLWTGTPAPPKPSITLLESPAGLPSWPGQTLTLGLTFREPLTLKVAHSKLFPFGKAFHSGFFVIGEGLGTFRSQGAVPIDTVIAEALRVARHLAFVKPRHDCEIAARLLKKYGLQSYTLTQALQRFTRDQRLQNLAKNIIASENTRKYALGVIEGSKPTLYAIALRAKPNRIAHQLNGLIEGAARIPARSGLGAFQPPKPDAVRNIVLQARARDPSDPRALFEEASMILGQNCKIKLFPQRDRKP